MDLSQTPGKLLILTGERRSGKTSLCSLLVETARGAGWDVGGLLSPAVFEDGQKTAIDVLELPGNTRRRLAQAHKAGDLDIQTAHWTFDSEVLAWGDQILTQSIPCGLLVVDELGPLELLRSQGWTSAFTVLDSRLYTLAVVVIRPELLKTARCRWPHAAEIAITSPVQAADLADQVFSGLGMI